jgi:DNA-binding XRE family transcriptional regulator
VNALQPSLYFIDWVVFFYYLASNMQMTLKEIADYVKLSREKQYKSQAKAAKAIGIGERTLAKVESGEETVSNRFYQKIASGLDIGFTLSFPIKKE